MRRSLALLRYHHTSQIARRGLRLAKGKVPYFSSRRPAESTSFVPPIRTQSNFGAILQREVSLRDTVTSCQNARGVLEGRFSFLNDERTLPDPIDWRGGRARGAQLWRFQLHYQEYLLDLIACGVEKGVRTLLCKAPEGPFRQKVPAPFLDRAWDLVDQWISGNSLDDSRVLDDAWHPYCISRRLPVWMLLWTASPQCGSAAERILSSMYKQACYLERRLERDLGGNHLLENLKALLMAGLFFEGPDAERWQRKANRLLIREIRGQIPPSGEHFERSPMYHCHVLRLLWDVADAVEQRLPDLSAECRNAVERMSNFLAAIVHPDGEIPLLGDSCFGEVISASTLIGARCEVPPASEEEGTSCELLIASEQGDEQGAESRTSRGQRAASGEREENEIRNSDAPRTSHLAPPSYWTFRDGGDFLLFDAGPVGADHLPAHAHADLLGIEASIRGRRLLVDSGVFNYEADEMRRYCRSTAAHNVLQIDETDQCDMWSKFRMGYRGHPCELKCGQQGDFSWASASHNAYRRSKVPKVSRWIACRTGGPWIVVDSARGRGRHRLDNRLHLHPDAQTDVIGEGAVAITLGDVDARLKFLSPGRVAVEQGWYCPEFGRRQSSQVIHWSAQSEMPTICVWYLTWCDGECDVRLEPMAEHYAIVVRDRRGEVRLDVDAKEKVSPKKAGRTITAE